MNIVKETLGKRLSYKIVLVLLIIGICVLLFPMLLIAKCNVPSADDFTYSAQIRNEIVNGNGFSFIIKAIFDQIDFYYHTWQGLLSSIFMWCLQPAVFGEKYYAIVPYMMLISLFIGIFLFLYRFFQIFESK